MEIRQKILDTIYKHNKSAYGASSECIEVVYDDDYDNLTDDLVKLFSLYIVSNRRELLYAFANHVNNNELKDSEQITDYSIKKYLKSI